VGRYAPERGLLHPGEQVVNIANLYNLASHFGLRTIAVARGLPSENSQKRRKTCFLSNIGVPFRTHAQMGSSKMIRLPDSGIIP
jgi:hypothetical protein